MVRDVTLSPGQLPLRGAVNGAWADKGAGPRLIPMVSSASATLSPSPSGCEYLAPRSSGTPEEPAVV